jgi:hypothetical protein
MNLPDDYDPTPEAKVWYRSTTDGQLGWFVKRGGIQKIKYDRPGPREILKPFNKIDWTLCDDHRALTPVHLGEITFEADKVLRRILGQYEGVYRDWRLIPGPERKQWIAVGPRDDPARIKLYRTIQRVMGDVDDEENRRKSDPE